MNKDREITRRDVFNLIEMLYNPGAHNEANSNISPVQCESTFLKILSVRENKGESGFFLRCNP